MWERASRLSEPKVSLGAKGEGPDADSSLEPGAIMAPGNPSPSLRKLACGSLTQRALSQLGEGALASLALTNISAPRRVH